MANLHRIKAQLYDNVLTENPNDFLARVRSEKSLDVKDICDSAKERGGADISAAAMEHAVNLWLKEMAYNLCDGFSINTGWFTATVSIRGVFDKPTETFNPQKHSVLFEFTQGSKMRQELDNVTVDILGVADASLFIGQVLDVKTGSINDLLTPNRNLKISGYKLKIVGDSPQNGIYFVRQEGEERIKVDATDIVTNNPSELVIVIPPLETGKYHLEVTTQYAISSLLKEPRTCVFDKNLTVK